MTLQSINFIKLLMKDQLNLKYQIQIQLGLKGIMIKTYTWL